MNKGVLVKWVTASGVSGVGTTISEEEDGHVLVAIDAPPGEPHPVIYCAVTWLTVVE